MEITTNAQPRSGLPFDFVIAGGIGTTNITVYIAGQQISVDDCDDPPCHQMIRIPDASVRNTLSIIAKDSQGNIFERDYVIEDSDSGSGAIQMGAAG